MAGLEARMQVHNSRGKPHTVFVEPWGEDFTLLESEMLEIVARSEPCGKCVPPGAGDGTEVPWFAVVECPEGTQVYLEATAGYDVLQSGKVLKCGHNRN